MPADPIPIRSPSGSPPKHPCVWPGCIRSYKRLDHLERHEKTHLGEMDYKCPVCHKQYARSDVLNRHLVQTHGEKTAGIGRPRKTACVQCVQARIVCEGAPPRPCKRCVADGRTCQYRHLRTGRDSASPPSTSAVRSGSMEEGGSEAPSQVSQLPSEPEAVQQAANYDLTGRLGYGMTDPMLGLTALGDAAESAERPLLQPGSSDLPMPWLTSPPTQDNNIDSASWLTDLFFSATTNAGSQELFAFDSVSSTAPAMHPTFEWGFTESDFNIFAPIGTHAPPTPTGEPESTAHMDEDPKPIPEEEHLVHAVRPVEIDGRLFPRELPTGQPVDSSWPINYKPDTPEGNVSLPPPTPRGSTAHALADLVLPSTSTSITAKARDVLQTLTVKAHQEIWPMPDLSNFPSTETLTTCVNLYLANFSPWLPIADCPRGSFKLDKSAPILLKAMAAIGSTYARDGLERLGAPLNELVRREILFIGEHDQRFAFEFAHAQACLLQAYFGRFSGSPHLFHHSEVARGSLVTACKRMHLLHEADSAATELARRKPEASALDMERAYKQDHRRKRLGWCIYLYDAQLACFFNLPAQITWMDIRTSLPAYMYGPSNLPPFSTVLSDLLDQGRMPELPSDLSYSCVGYALYRLCLDAAALQMASRRGSSAYRYSLIFPTYAKHPQAILDQLGRQALNGTSTPTHLVLSCAALSYHSHIQFTRVGLMDPIRVAAGKMGDPVREEAAGKELSTWCRENPAGARNVFAHAAMLRCLLNRFTFDTPTEVCWTFDAALAMWAMIKYTNLSLILPSNLRRQITIGWTHQTALDAWIVTGEGLISVQGLGGGSGLDPRAVLQSAADRLEVMSWGLAARYRTVLLNLLEKEVRSLGS